MLAGMIFKKEPFFCGADNADQLVKIAKVMGTEGLNNYLDTYDLELEPDLQQQVGVHSKKDWQTFVNESNKARVVPDVLDLLERMLRYDPSERILPQEAMKHKFFDSVPKGE